MFAFPPRHENTTMAGGAWDLLRALRALVVRLPDLADREDVQQQLSAAAQGPQRVSLRSID